MGLFDFWKKKDSAVTTMSPGKSSASATVTPGQAPAAQASTTTAFRGDLANFGNIGRAAEPAKADYDDVTPSTPRNYGVDSGDSDIFMSFNKKSDAIWICPECGTYNDKSMTGCVVCGLVRRRR